VKPTVGTAGRSSSKPLDLTDLTPRDSEKKFPQRCGIYHSTEGRGGEEVPAVGGGDDGHRVGVAERPRSAGSGTRRSSRASMSRAAPVMHAAMGGKQ
jgi:hypothetical protein